MVIKNLDSLVYIGFIPMILFKRKASNETHCPPLKTHEEQLLYDQAITYITNSYNQLRMARVGLQQLADFMHLPTSDFACLSTAQI
jgi:hypothetical protein